MKKIIYAMLVFLFVTPSKADEGMWLPHLISGHTYEEMVRLGLKLTPEQIFSVNNSSLKDAVVRLGGGFCTGEIVSNQGLMLTNHHCGFDAIQNLSSADEQDGGKKNYLQNGFWAKQKSDELPAGFGVSFLMKVEDVTDEVLGSLNETMTLVARNAKIAEIVKTIQKRYEDKDAFISGTVRSFYEGNKYYVLVYQTFNDVRLVGTPPQSLGKFGGETDNWMWPRHTCDFSMFRVYANKDNKPAKYSKDNVPYIPKHHLPVSLKGLKEGDYSMIFGYPGRTDRYLTSYGVNFATDHDFPARVKIRRTKLDVYEKYMAQSEITKLAYASKYAGISNYWKNFMGQARGLKRLQIADRKKAEELKFAAWANENVERKAVYGEVINLYEKGYQLRNQYYLSSVYISEAIYGIESFAWASGFSTLLDSGLTKKQIEEAAGSLTESGKEHFKDYRVEIDKEVCAAMLDYFWNNVPKEQQPELFVKLAKKYHGNFEKLTAELFKSSIFIDATKTNAFLKKPNLKKLKKDPIFKLAEAFIKNYQKNVAPKFLEANESLAKAKRLFVKGLIEMNATKTYSSDANSTMRVTYGSVLDYFPADAVHYEYFTTLEGVVEKYVPNDIEFDLPAGFVDLAKSKNYGQYADADGKLHVCFLSNNDITGGNSGSPVINGNGELLGIAFDGNWEAMSGDIAFEPALQRTISVDIRYVLWIIDKYSGAGHLVEEMTLVK